MRDPNGMLDKADKTLHRLTEMLDAAERALATIEAALGVVKRLAESSAGDARTATEALIAGLVEDLFADLNDVLDRAQRSLDAQINHLAFFDDLEDELLDANEAAVGAVKAAGQSLSDRAHDLGDQIGRATAEASNMFDTWTEHAERTAHAIAEAMRTTQGAIKGTMPSADDVLQKYICTDMLNHIDGVAKDADRYLTLVEQAIDRTGGALTDGLERISEALDALNEVLSALRPIAEPISELA